MKYSGSVEFDFEIERLKDCSSGTYHLVDELVVDENDSNFSFELINLTVRGSAYFTPGKYYGPPENCYPDEGDADLESALDSNKKDWQDLLTKEEREILIDEIVARVQEDCEPSSDYESLYLEQYKDNYDDNY